MKVVKRGKEKIREINVLLYSQNSKILWEYRNVGYRLMEELECKINLTLTGNLQTSYNMFSIVIGEVDIFISDHFLNYKQRCILEEKIQEYAPKCHMIFRNRAGYIHFYQCNPRMKCIEHWNIGDGNFAKKVSYIISRIKKETENYIDTI